MGGYSTEFWRGLHSPASWHTFGCMTDVFASRASPHNPSLERQIVALAEQLGRTLERRGWRVTTAESCTGGGIAAAITEVPGSSAWFEFGLVAYADRAKQSLLAVDGSVLERAGAVSEPVVREMVSGALTLSGAELGVAVSGVAGPGGGSVDKPVGTVWLAWGQRRGQDLSLTAQRRQFSGDRSAVRQQTIVAALSQLIELAGAESQ